MLVNPMSIITVYVKAYINDEYQIEFRQINNIINPLENFNEKFDKLEEENVNSEINQEINFFFVIGTEERIKDIEKFMTEDIKTVYKKFKKQNYMKYELEGSLILKCFFEKEVNKNIINNVINFWFEIEEPILCGKQVLLKSYLLKDLYGRRIVGAYPSYLNTKWNLLLEGGIKLSLESDDIYLNRYITSDDFNKWCQGDIINILNNPCYAFGIFFEQIDLFYEWQRALLYQLAILNVRKIPLDTLERIYKDFLEFIKKEVCEWQQCPTIITKEVGLRTLEKLVKAMKEYLRAEEQNLISKNNLITLGSRYIYMPVNQEIISKYFPIDNNKSKRKYNMNTLKKLLSQLEQETNYEKGIAMEKLARYFLESIPRSKNYWTKNKNFKRRN